MGQQAVVDSLVGMVMPFLVALVNQSSWSPKLRGIVALLLCALVTTGVCVLRGDLNWADWRASLLFIFGAAILSYQTWWKPSTLAPAIERATTVTGGVG